MEKKDETERKTKEEEELITRIKKGKRKNKEEEAEELRRKICCFVNSLLPCMISAGVCCEDNLWASFSVCLWRSKKASDDNLFGCCFEL